MTEQLANPALQAGFGGLCIVCLGIQFWVIKKLFSMLSNDLDHIQQEVRQVKLTLNEVLLTMELAPDAASGGPKKSR